MSKNPGLQSTASNAPASPAASSFFFDGLRPDSRIQDWITLPEPGVVQLTSGKVDIGQGISTALAQIVAEELGVDLGQVRVRAPSTRYSPDEGVTSGSFSVQKSGQAIRLACASLRQAALRACASAQQANAAGLDVRRGCFLLPSGEAVSNYWDPVIGPLISQPIDPAARARDTTGYAVVGTNAPRLDLPAKVFGTFQFIQDLVLPDMLHGRVVRTPNRAARLKRLAVDASMLGERFHGTQLIHDGHFLAVLSSREETAIAAAAWLAGNVEWEMPVIHPTEDTLPQFLRTARQRTRSVALRGNGEPRTQLELHARYSRPYVAHASIAPSCGLALWAPGRLEVWSHSQGIFNLRAALETFMVRDHPERAGLPIDVHHAESAGCYGHNPADDVAFDAVLLARAVPGRPVRVLWSRADELSCGPLGPAQAVEIAGSVGADGRIACWRQEGWANGYTTRPGRHGHDVLSFLGAGQLSRPFQTPVALDPPLSVGGGGDRNAEPQYDIDDLRVDHHLLEEMPLRASALRTLGAHPNVFAIESFMDELADSAGFDPVDFRLQHLSDPRARDVIEQAIASAPWWSEARAEGVGVGLGYARYKLTGAWCAVAVRIVAEETIRVTDACAAVDVGLVVNPDGVRNQIEGGIIQGCSWTLHEAIHFNEREITTRSWEDYPILRFGSAPRVQVVVIDRPDQPSVGAGEASLGPASAAIGNAVYNALGIRVRDLPITIERLMEAMES